MTQGPRWVRDVVFFIISSNNINNKNIGGLQEGMSGFIGFRRGVYSLVMPFMTCYRVLLGLNGALDS